MRMPYTTPPTKVGAYRVYQKHDDPDPISPLQAYEWWAWWDGTKWGGTTGSPERAKSYYDAEGMAYEEHLDWLDSDPQPQPTEPPMNELLQALETMIRRIVAEEVAKCPPPNLYTAAAFKSLVREACLDQPWFDGAIASEVANNQADDIDALAKRLFADDTFIDKLDRNTKSVIDETSFVVRVE